MLLLMRHEGIPKELSLTDMLLELQTAKTVFVAIHDGAVADKLGGYVSLCARALDAVELTKHNHLGSWEWVVLAQTCSGGS